MALPPAAVWPLRSPWAELDAFLSTQPLTLRSTHRDVYTVHGGGIGLRWPGYGGHIELAHAHRAYLIRLPHELVRADRFPQAHFAPGLFARTRARRACRRRRTIRTTVLPPVLAPPAARPHNGGGTKRRGGEDDDDAGENNGYTVEGAFVPLQRTAAWWGPGGGFHSY